MLSVLTSSPYWRSVRDTNSNFWIETSKLTTGLTLAAAYASHVETQKSVERHKLCTIETMSRI